MTEQLPLLEQLYRMGRAFGQKPSSWVLADQQTCSTPDALWALDFDLLVYAVGRAWEIEQIERNPDAGRLMSLF